jgi:cholesterol oxidase
LEPRDPKWLRVTETMRGEVTLGVTDPRAAQCSGARRADVAVRLRVEGEARLLLADPRHEARLTGYVESGALGGKLPILDGTFNVLTYGDDFNQRRMLYRLHFRDGVGRMLTLVGEKLVPQLPATRPWRDTSTMFTRLIRDSVDAEGNPRREVAAAGILRVRPSGVLGELVTMRASGVGVVARFLIFFLETLARVYLRP